MEEGCQQNAAINLSTGSVGREGKESVPNGDIRNGNSNHESAQGQATQGVAAAKGSPGVVGAAKRKLKSVTDSVSQQATTPQNQQQQTQLTDQSQQFLLMMAAQHGLSPQQVQHIQQQLVASQQLQQVMQQPLMLQHQQQQQQKLQEQMLHQLNEQLQLNVLQQSQLIQQQQQQDKGKTSKQAQQQLQQLAVQQQQLIQQVQQIQMQQRQYLLACLVQPFGVPQGMMSPAEIQQLWKEVATHSGLEDNALKNNLNGMTIPTLPSSMPSISVTQSPVIQAPSYLSNGGIPVDSFVLPGGGGVNQSLLNIRQNDGAKVPTSSDNGTNGSASSDRLFRHNVCKWPGCDTPCEDYSAFLKHLNSEHILDDRSTAQARVQMQVVSQLEIQLSREKDLLQAMMQHLHMKPKLPQPHSPQPQTLPPPQSQPPSQPEIKPEPVTLNTPILPKHPSAPLTTAPPLPPVTMVTPPIVAMAPTLTPTSISQPPVSQAPPSPQQMPTSAGTIRRRVSDKCNLPISAEIQRNREFYKNTDVRPPFTYASLIRQAIIESPHRQLTLNEIYQWFQNTFAYFRRNEATWKNAVRHNLSLHKCFMRVENVKGAVWTVDEVEFYKRRPQKLSGNVKSPSLSDPASYNETLNASLRVRLQQLHGPLGDISRAVEAALGESSIALLNAVPSLGQESAEDLSMKSHSNSQDGMCVMSKEEEMMMTIKQEPSADEEPGEFLDMPETDAADVEPSEENQAMLISEVVTDKTQPEHGGDVSMEDQSETVSEDAVNERTDQLIEEDAEMLALQQMQQEAAMVAVATHSTGV